MRKLTPDFYVFMTEQLENSLIGNTLDTIHYMALADVQNDWQNSLKEPDTSVNSVTRTEQKKIIAAKKITDADVNRVIKGNYFTAGTVYDMFDDSEDMSQKNFYIAVKEVSGAFSVWKCLYNNKGLPATVPPTYSSTAALENFQITSDGYIWKFMYRVTSEIAKKFSTNIVIPVQENATVKNNAVDGSIDVIFVDDSGRNYNSYCYGNFKQIAVAGNNLIHSLSTPDNVNSIEFGIQSLQGAFLADPAKPIYLADENDNFVRNGSVTNIWNLASYFSIRATNNASYVEIMAPLDLNLPGGVVNIYQFNAPEDARIVNPDNPAQWITDTSEAIARAVITTTRYKYVPTLSANTDFYKNSSIYIRSGRGAGQLRTVAEYIVTGNEHRVLIDKPFTIVPDINSSYEILPRVIITGDGTGSDGTGSATAIPLVDNSTNSIISIQMVDPGKDYTYATAQVIANTGYIDISTGLPLTANEAMLRAILPPKGGHGANVYSELYSDSVCISTEFSNTENGIINVGNSFSEILLLKQPQASNTELTLDQSALLFQDDEPVFQTDGRAKAIVSNRDGNTLRLTKIEGQFTTGGTIITDRTAGADATANVTLVDRSVSVLNGLTRFSVEIQGTGFDGFGFRPNDVVRQGSADEENAHAEGVVFAANTSFITLTQSKGVWNVSDDISGTVATMINTANGATAKILGKVDPDIIIGSGIIQHMETISPVMRTASQNETVRLVIKTKPDDET